MKSIQSKFLALIISGMLILAIAISAVSIVYISKILGDDSDIITESVANTESLRINDILETAEATSRIMENYVLSTIGGVDRLGDGEYVESYSQVAKETFYAIVENYHDICAFYLRFDPLLTDATSGFFVKSMAGGKDFEDLNVTNLGDLKNAAYDDICWFIEPKNAGAPTWVKPHSSQTYAGERISYVIPLYKDRTFIGVVGVDIMFSAITEKVKGISVYDNGFAYLANADEKKIYYSPVDDHMLIRAHTDHGFAEEHKLLDNGMTLIIHADYSDIHRDSYRMLLMIIVIVALFLAGFIVITTFISSRIVGPLKKLTDAAEHLADGKVEISPDCYEADGEVGVLARSFKKTSEQIRGYMKYINALAYKDSLTGVKNRTAYNEATTGIDLKIRTERGQQFAVLVADINGLKLTNDKYGHEVGNKLIVRAAKAICDAFKHSPVFRVGGDEFVAILKEADLENYSDLLPKIDAACAQATITVGEDDIPVSVARAVAVYDERIDVSFEDVFTRADRKMYEHKLSMRKGLAKT